MSCGSDAAGFAICWYLLLCVTPSHAVCICRIPNHSSTILKSLLKLLVDATDSSPYLTVQAFEQLNQKTAECLVVLLRCCGKQVEDQLKELQGVGHKEVEECIEKVLQETGSGTNASVQIARQINVVT